jgi:hypothetical protein
VKLSKGESLVKEIPVRFYKSIQTLSISIDNTHVTINRSLDKALINNLYTPVQLDSINPEKGWFFNYLKRKFIKHISALKRIFSF